MIIANLIVSVDVVNSLIFTIDKIFSSKPTKVRYDTNPSSKRNSTMFVLIRMLDKVIVVHDVGCLSTIYK